MVIDVNYPFEAIEFQLTEPFVFSRQVKLLQSLPDGQVLLAPVVSTVS